MAARGYQRASRGGTAARAGRVRIVAGRLKGRRLPVPAVRGLRPTPERTRETLFNWLQGGTAGARVLDLFAGSGALALEAISRGADHALLLEAAPRVARELAALCAELAPEARVLRADALAWLRSAPPGDPFDLVFVDPPFEAGIGRAALTALAQRTDLAADARLYVEWPGREAPPFEGLPFTELRRTRAGDSVGVLLARDPDARPPRRHVGTGTSGFR